MLELYLHNLITRQTTFERLVIRKATFETQFGNKTGYIGSKAGNKAGYILEVGKKEGYI